MKTTDFRILKKQRKYYVQREFEKRKIVDVNWFYWKHVNTIEWMHVNMFGQRRDVGQTIAVFDSIEEAEDFIHKVCEPDEIFYVAPKKK